MRLVLLLKFSKKIFNEKGQALTEFAIILPIILLLLMLPFDYARLIYTKMSLNSAATEALATLKPSDVGGPGGSGSPSQVVLDSINRSYGNSIDVGRVSIDRLDISNEGKKEYTYYVYTSDKAHNPFDKQFDERASNYFCKTVSLKISFDFQPVTFLGRQLMGRDVKVSSREYSRDIYVEGYRP